MLAGISISDTRRFPLTGGGRVSAVCEGQLTGLIYKSLDHWAPLGQCDHGKKVAVTILTSNKMFEVDVTRDTFN